MHGYRVVLSVIRGKRGCRQGSRASFVYVPAAYNTVYVLIHVQLPTAQLHEINFSYSSSGTDSRWVVVGGPAGPSQYFQRRKEVRCVLELVRVLNEASGKSAR